jgi:hypothetical protein
MKKHDLFSASLRKLHAKLKHKAKKIISGLDERYPSSHSWTLILLVSGLCIGCWNAVRWVLKENKEMQEEEKKDE